MRGDIKRVKTLNLFGIFFFGGVISIYLLFPPYQNIISLVSAESFPNKDKEKGRSIPLEELALSIKIKAEKAKLHLAGQDKEGIVVVGYRPGVTLRTCTTFPLGTFIERAEKGLIIYTYTRTNISYTWTGDFSPLTQEQDSSKEEDNCFAWYKKEGISVGELDYF